ncbi:VOC family protein [Piscibacillus salipiscarius]|uniref:VOC family protein n=1 Tax=Piscibacillus salipiscarius TaxID=299480 RepID=UPI0024365BA7|nr:VOC family protein [Piscibacillus salipiscarius]
MHFKEFGLILFVEKYDECISFYRDVLKLNVLNIKDTLVKFEIPQGYLMVEQGGVGLGIEKTRDQNPTVLRFDVDSLDQVVSDLDQAGVDFSNKQLTFDWGKLLFFMIQMVIG